MLRTILFLCASGLLFGCSAPLAHQFKSERESLTVEGMAIAAYATPACSWLAKNSVVRVNGSALGEASRMVYSSNTGDGKVAMTGVMASRPGYDLIRHVLWDDHNGFWVADQLIAKQDGEYVLSQEWFINGDLTCRGNGVEAAAMVRGNPALLAIQAPKAVQSKLAKDRLSFSLSGGLKAGESLILPAFFLIQDRRRQETLRVVEVAPQSFVAIFGESRSMAAIGKSRLDAHVFGEAATFVCENGTINARGHHFDMIEFYADLFNLKIKSEK
ncbi:MAG: hypothetical protein AB7F32_02910 [Victivallaceae bacterium]